MLLQLLFFHFNAAVGVLVAVAITADAAWGLFSNSQSMPVEACQQALATFIVLFHQSCNLLLITEHAAQVCCFSSDLVVLYICKCFTLKLSSLLLQEALVLEQDHHEC